MRNHSWGFSTAHYFQSHKVSRPCMRTHFGTIIIPYGTTFIVIDDQF